MKKAVFILMLCGYLISYSQTQIVEQSDVTICDNPNSADIIEGELSVAGGIGISQAAITSTSISGGDSQCNVSNYSIALLDNSYITSYSLGIGSNIHTENAGLNILMGSESFVVGGMTYLYSHGYSLSSYFCENIFLFGYGNEGAYSNGIFVFGKNSDAFFSDSSFSWGKECYINNYISEFNMYLGAYNFAFGYKATILTSYNSFSFGENSYANGNIANEYASPDDYYPTFNISGNAYAIGKNAKVLKAGSAYAIGANSTAESFGQITLGSFNLNEFPNAQMDSWNNSDPLVVVGNGTSDAERSNAFIIMKSGDCIINGTLKVRDAGGDLPMGIYARP